MTLDDMFDLLDAARKLSNHVEYVVVGSLSALGVSQDMSLPAEMAMSLDLDCYTKYDPEKIFSLAYALGEGSEYEKQYAFHIDPVSPKLPTLPEGWENRLLQISRRGITAWFLEPNDAAISKYARGEPRDISWIRAGIAAGIVSLPIVRFRFRDTLFMDESESREVLARILEDIDATVDADIETDGNQHKPS